MHERSASSLQRAPAASSWILRPHPNPSAMLRLFCLPYAGGDTWVYHDWYRTLPDFVEICPIRLPGRGSRMADAPLESIDALVAELAEGVHEALDRPFAIFGHSMGALIGFELARHLRMTSKRRPVMLCVGACQAPQNVSFRPPISKLGDYVLLEVLRGRYGASMYDFSANPELMDLALPIMRADFALVENYEYRDGDALDCPIVAYRGLSDKTLKDGDMDAWRRQTTDVFRRHMVQGDHFFPVGAKDELLRHLSEDLRWAVS